MDYDSSDSDDDQNNDNGQFNARQTEAVAKCVSKVFKRIINMSKQDTKSRKEVKKPIRKEKRKAKLRKPDAAEVLTHIRALCDAFKSIASLLSCPQVEVPGPSTHTEAIPGPSKHSEAIPGSSRHSEAVPGTSRHSEAVPGPSKHSDTVPGSSRHSKAVPGPSKHSETIPGPSKHTDAVPECSKHSDAVPGPSKHSEIISESSKHSEVIPGSSKHSKVIHGSCKHSEVIPGSSKHSEVIPGSSKHIEVISGSSKHSEVIPGSSKHSEIIPESSRDSEVVPVTSRHSEAITGNCRPNMETAPVSSNHRTERVVTGTSSFKERKKEQSEDVTKKHMDTTESLRNRTLLSETIGAGPKTGTSSTIEDHVTSKNCTKATAGIFRNHVEARSGSLSTQSEKNIPESSRNQTERSEPKTHTKTAPEISGSTTQTMPGTSKKLTTKVPETSRNNPDNLTKTSKSFTSAVKKTSKTLTEAYNTTAKNGIAVSSEIVLTSSRQNMEQEMSGAPASHSDVTESGTSRHTEIVVPDIPDNSTKTMPGTSKSPTEKGPAISKNYPDNVVTETSARFVKPVEDISKSRTERTDPVTSRNHLELMVSGTAGSRTADPETAASRTKDHHGTVESRTKAVSENSANHMIIGPATKTVIPETLINYAKTMPGTSRNDSNTELHRVSSSTAVTESSKSNNIAVEYNSLNRHDEVPPTEGNSQICTKIKVATTESEEINNNISATKINTEKRKRTNSIDDGPKRARVDDKCTLCGKSISNEEFTKHYQEQHGMHHEIQHNNRNFENKIQDLDRRLHDTNKNKTNNEQKEKITFDTKKRTTARSFSAPNEDTKQTVANSKLVIITDSDEAKEPEVKKKRTSTRSDSAPNERIVQTSSTTIKEEANHNTVLDAFVIDLTEDNDLDEPKLSTNITITKCNPKPGDDDQTLNDSQFIDTSDADDTSLYETSGENETKIAEALLLENVKDEKTANNQLDSDIKVVNDVFPTLLKNEKPLGTESHTTAKQSTKQIIEGIDQRDSSKKQYNSEKIVSETSGRGIGVIPGSPISNTKIKDETSVNLSDPETASYSQASQPKISNNITAVMSTASPLIRTKAASETDKNHREINLGTSATLIETIVPSGDNSKDVPAISLKHAAQTKQKPSQRDEKQNNKPTRKTPYEKPNKISLYTDKITNGATATKATNAPKVSMLNSTTTITTQPIHKTSRLSFTENNTSKPNIHKLNTDNAPTGTILTRLTPEVSVSSPNSTNDTSKVQNEQAKEPNSARQHTSNTNNNTNKLKPDLVFLGPSIIVNGSKDSVPNSSVSVSLPHSTTITPLPVTQIASQSSGKYCTDASTDVTHLSTSLRPTANTQVSPNITTSLLVHSALKQQRQRPHKLPNLIILKLNPETQSTSKRASDSAPVLLPSRHSNTKPREHLTTENIPANVQNAQIYQPGIPVIKSTDRRPVSPISHCRDFSRNTENIIPCNTTPTPSTNKSSPKQHPSTTVQANTSVFQNTPATAAPGYFTQSYYRKKSNTTVNAQFPQTQWYSPVLVDTSTRELNTLSSNLNRNANRASTAVNAHVADPQTHRWHRPVEPHNERTGRTAQGATERTLNHVPSFSNRTSIINQRPTHKQRIVNTTQSFSNSEGQPNLFLRQQSRLFDQRPRPIQNGRTWHTPVREPRTNN